MESILCLLCTKTSSEQNIEFYDVECAIVPSSQKPLHVVLQHLANCIKYKLIFQSGTYVCAKCFRELSNYDHLMVNLLVAQKRMTYQLQVALSEKTIGDRGQLDIEKPMEIEMHFNTDTNLENAFDPNLDTKEELIATDDDIVIAEEFADDSIGVESDSDHTNFESEWSIDKRRNRQECVVCGSVFSSKFLLQRHITQSHEGKQYTCKICGVTRKDEEYLELHMNVHEGKTENECRYCPKRFSRPVNTLRHMHIHWNKKKYQCEKCGERFSQDNLLYNHRMRHEAEENPVICSICNQSFKSKKTYNHHVLIHQENRPRHHCVLCSKSFTERYTLKMHLKTHNGNNNTPHTVEQKFNKSKDTGKTIINMTDCREHENVCIICSTKHNAEEELRRHLHEIHDVFLK